MCKNVSHNSLLFPFWLFDLGMHTRRCGRYSARMRTGTWHTKTAVGHISSGAYPSLSRRRTSPSIYQQPLPGSSAKKATPNPIGAGCSLFPPHRTSPHKNKHTDAIQRNTWPRFSTKPRLLDKATINEQGHDH